MPETIYISSEDGEEWQVFEGIKETSLTYTDENDDVFIATPFLLEHHLFCDFDFSLETKAQILVFKNYNCYSRFIRRRKRHAEQERRRRLKEGSFHA